jgi:hypothetical protein
LDHCQRRLDKREGLNKCNIKYPEISTDNHSPYKEAARSESELKKYNQ